MNSRNENPDAVARAGASRDKDQVTRTSPYKEKSQPGLAVDSEELYRLNPVASRHPYYHRILRDALALLRADLQAFARDYTWDELCRPGNGGKLRNTLGVAVVRARDALGVKRHGVANHESTVRELKRICCGGKFRRPAET